MSGAASLIWMFQLFSIKAINSIMDVGSILIGSVIDFIFLKDFIESVIKKISANGSVWNISSFNDSRIFSDYIKVINAFINSRVAL